MVHEFLYGESLLQVSVSRRDGIQQFEVDGDVVEAETHRVSQGISIRMGNRSVFAYVVEMHGVLHVRLGGRTFCFKQPDGDADGCVVQGVTSGEARLKITAPMPGNVLKICVNQGDPVVEGLCLAIVEAMKMETELCSAIQGKVKKICIPAGNQVDAGEILIELEEQEKEC